ncbi:MAG: alpha/beta hydrolase, partial [Bdellovibrionota bacterium]
MISHTDRTLPKPEAFFIPKPSFILKGVRYPNPGGVPIVLLHGLMCNSRAWREIGYMLHEMGFDVWMPNFRGHGNGAQRSFVYKPQPGSYRFCNLVVEDFPAIVEHVWEATGTKMIICGHSNGANVSKAALAGVTRDGSGGLTVDRELAERLVDTRILAYVSAGGQVHFRGHSGATRFLAKAIRAISIFTDFTVPAPARNVDPLLPDAVIGDGWFRRSYRKLVEKVGPKVVPVGVFNMDNLDHDVLELARITEKATSVCPADLAQSYSAFVATEKFVEDGVDFEPLVPARLPMLMIAAEQDYLALPGDILE